MAIREDVLVIGGGLAGATAALAAAETGATVRLVSEAKSTLRHASGLVDVLGYPNGSGRDAPVATPFEAIPDLPPDHPYGVVGADAIRAGLALFDRVVGGRYCGDHTDRNALVPTQTGSVKPTARYPATVAPGLASAAGDVLLVGFETLPDFDAPLAASHLDRVYAGDVRGVTLPSPADFDADADVTRFARALDENEPLAGTPARDALAAAIDPHVDGETRVGVPAMLGRDDVEAVRTDLETGLGVDVFEVPGGPPSLPGLRLDDLLSEALDAAGVRITTGNRVVGHDAEGDRVTAALVDHAGSTVPYRADEFVLATGGLVGGGVASDRDGVREPVFGCRVPHPADRYDWFADDPFGDHAFARFGVVPDERLRPTDADGEPTYENLRAAGAVVGGADVAAEKSAGGVSLATGVVAGRGAGTNATDGAN
jgi:glycerol-3-phosphate dehydrogenase subunit B